MSKTNKNQSKQKNSVRIIALILAIIMIAGAATVAFSIIGGIINGNDTVQSDSHEGHNHD